MTKKRVFSAFSKMWSWTITKQSLTLCSYKKYFCSTEVEDNKAKLKTKI
jgi:hypothetical protein